MSAVRCGQSVAFAPEASVQDAASFQAVAPLRIT